MLITREDIQRIDDEHTLLHFLEEKLNLSVPEGLTLDDITLKFSNFALGLSGTVANQVTDCQELSISPGQPSGIFLIRFNSESGYSDALRAVAEGLDRHGRNPADLRFICLGTYCQPFAFAYFNKSSTKNWNAEVLTVFTWTEENNHIHTSSEHELSAFFSAAEPRAKSYDASQAKNTPPDHTVEPKELLNKLQNTGTPLDRLSRHGNIHAGITPGYTNAFIIDEYTREQLINDDPKSMEIIKPFLKPRKWVGESAHIICIPSSKNMKWPWSGIRDESEADRIFKETYPAVSEHMNYHRDKLEKRNAYQIRSALYYWEYPVYSFYSTLESPKIFYPPVSSSMRAAYDTSQKLLFSSAFFSTTDVSLLAILNSKLFAWYTHKKYWSLKYNHLNLQQRNIGKAPIATRTEKQKEGLSDLVQQILDDSYSLEVPNIEREIDQLVYELYELTPAEIALIEEETNK